MREQTGRNQDIQKLCTFIHFTGNAVLNQIFPFQLFDGGVREIHITPVIDELIHLVKFSFGVIG